MKFFYFLFLHLFIVFPSAVRAGSDGDSVKVDNNVLCYAALGTVAYLAGGMLVMQNVWYRDKKIVPFHFYNDNRGYLQVDKFGHAFGSYFQSYAGYYLLRNSGVSKTSALLFGGSLGLILQTPIEIMDGIHEGWGFSWGDMAANAFGAGLLIGQELLFDEQLVKFKFSYWESSYSGKANGYLGKSSMDRILKDYNGHTYWFSLPLNKIVTLNRLPEWLCVSAGYGADGMFGEFENISEYKGIPIPQTERYRQYLFSLDIDWTKIETDSGFLRALLTGLTFIKLPFPALEFTSHGNVIWHWVYF